MPPAMPPFGLLRLPRPRRAKPSCFPVGRRLLTCQRKPYIRQSAPLRAASLAPQLTWLPPRRHYCALLSASRAASNRHVYTICTITCCLPTGTLKLYLRHFAPSCRLLTGKCDYESACMVTCSDTAHLECMCCLIRAHTSLPHYRHESARPHALPLIGIVSNRPCPPALDGGRPKPSSKGKPVHMT